MTDEFIDGLIPVTWQGREIEAMSRDELLGVVYDYHRQLTKRLRDLRDMRERALFMPPPQGERPGQ